MATLDEWKNRSKKERRLLTQVDLDGVIKKECNTVTDYKKFIMLKLYSEGYYQLGECSVSQKQSISK